MVGSTGISKIKTAIFISGNGSNMKSLIKFSKLKTSPIYVDLVLSSNKKQREFVIQIKVKLFQKFLILKMRGMKKKF